MNKLKNDRILLMHKFLNIIIILFAGFLLIYGIIGLAALFSLIYNNYYNHSNYRILIGIATILAGILSLFCLKAIDNAIMAFYDKPNSSIEE